AIGLLPATPARVAENVDVRGPDRETLVPVRAAVGMYGGGILRAKLGTDDACSLVHERCVPRRRHADCLREHSRDSGAGDSVQALVPPVVLGHTQTRDRGRGIAELARLLLQSHFGYECVDAL